ncbi:MAG: ankyrin repeat domain-containing protein [Pseudomonadota bacterium]
MGFRDIAASAFSMAAARLEESAARRPAHQPAACSPPRHANFPPQAAISPGLRRTSFLFAQDRVHTNPGSPATPPVLSQEGAPVGLSKPNPAELGKAPGLREKHADGTGRFYMVLDDGGHQYMMGGHSPARTTKMKAAEEAQRNTAQPSHLPDQATALAGLEQVGNRHPDNPNEMGQSPLMQALVNHDTVTALAMVAGGANLRAVDNMGRNAAHYAAINNNIPVMQEILKKNPSSMHARDRAGKDAFMCAVSFGKTEAMHCLKNHGANIHSLSDNNMSNLMWAAKNGQESLTTLLDMGADPFKKTPDHFSALDYAIRKRDVYNVDKTYTSAQRATAISNVQVLEARLRALSMKAAEQAQRNPAQPSHLPDQATAVARLRQVGFHDPDRPNAKGESPLMQALMANDTLTALALVAVGADLRAVDGMHRNVAHYAAINNNIPVMQEILKKNYSGPMF